MIRFILLITLLIATPTGMAQQLDDFMHNMVMTKTISQWIVQEYPKNVSLKEAEGLARHVLYQASAYDVEPDFLLGMIAVESGFKQRALSKSGARGIAQVMPKYHKKKIKGRNLFDPSVSIEVGTQILRECLEKTNQSRRQALKCYSGYRGKAATQYQVSVLQRIKSFNIYVKASRFDWRDVLTSAL